jgi:hypothetical protein
VFKQAEHLLWSLHLQELRAEAGIGQQARGSAQQP